MMSFARNQFTDLLQSSYFQTDKWEKVAIFLHAKSFLISDNNSEQKQIGTIGELKF